MSAPAVLLTARQSAVRDLVLDWAEQFARDVPVQAVDQLAREVAAMLPSAARARSRPELTPKTGATPEDARHLAARLEAGPAVGGCSSCGARRAPGRDRCAWCARRAARSAAQRRREAS
ncbi:hypothetical protein GCM10010193_69560 [Kitasatospora atroaurantiaca]|uniref:hypothetical protein n=1 Tax=Kitasatospora atroaurantiaca TaxID=285545 RepID=UPI0011A88D2F|nr:hypothetical protein [Kitasatospora atroaurantiaca]